MPYQLTESDLKRGRELIWDWLLHEPVSPEEMKFARICQEAERMRVALGRIPTIEEVIRANHGHSFQEAALLRRRRNSASL